MAWDWLEVSGEGCSVVGAERIKFRVQGLIGVVPRLTYPIMRPQK